MGSHKLSGIISADYLGIKKIKFWETSPENLLNNFNNLKLIILAKPFNKNALDLVNLAVKKGIKVYL